MGAQADPSLLAALFGPGVASTQGQDPAALAELFEGEAAAAAAAAQGPASVAARVRRIVAALREERPLRHLALTVVLEGDPQGAAFYWDLVEDRQHFSVSLAGRQAGRVGVLSWLLFFL